MTILTLAIEATQAQREAKATAQAVDGIGKAAEASGRAVDTAAKVVGTSLDAQTHRANQFTKAVGAVGEVTQIGQRVRLLGEEIRTLGSGMGSAASIGQTLSGVLIDIAQVSGKVEGGFGGFIGLLRANPLLVAATVLGGIATAMSLFGDETDAANNKLREQISLNEQLAKASADLAQQLQRTADLQRIGFAVDPQEQLLQRSRRIAEAASGLSGQQGPIGVEELARLSGASAAQIQALAQQRGLAPRTPYGGAVELTGVGGAAIPSPGSTVLTAAAAREVLLLLAQQLREQGAQGPDLAPGITTLLSPKQIAALKAATSYGPGLPPGGVQPPVTAPSNLFPTVTPQQPGYPHAIGPEVGPDYMTPQQLSAYQQGFAAPGIEMERDRLRQAEDAVQKLNERLLELKSLGQDVGTAIGSAFFSIVNGAANARQALAALLQQFVAIAQQRAIQGIANSIGNAFGASAGQTAQTPGTGNTGTSLRGGTP